MDVNALALAWLSAFQRIQSKPPAGPERPWAADHDALTNVIERALRQAGAATSNPGRIDPAQAGAKLDRTV